SGPGGTAVGRTGAVSGPGGTAVGRAGAVSGPGGTAVGRTGAISTANGTYYRSAGAGAGQGAYVRAGWAGHGAHFTHAAGGRLPGLWVRGKVGACRSVDRRELGVGLQQWRLPRGVDQL